MGPIYPYNCLRFQNPEKKSALKLFPFLLFSLGFLHDVNAQTSFSFSQISTGTEVMGPGRGAEMWQHLPWDNSNGNGVEIPAGSTTPGSNYYIRFAWKEIESDGTQGSYNWSVFDSRIQQAIDAGQMFSFGIMPICDGCTIGQIPTYLHNLMQAQSSSMRDWYYSGDGMWIPNWNSPPYLARYKALLMAVANHINTTSYKGIPYSSVIYYVDIRGYGNYGEWQCSPWYNSIPSNAMATAGTLDSLISYNLQAFPNYPNVILAGAFSDGAASFIPLQTTYYALTTKNKWGSIGWRRDQWGDPGTDIILSNNPNSYNSVSFSSLILNTYKNAPVVGEPLNSQSTVSGSCGSMYCDLPRQIQLYHTTSFGNGNLPNAANSSLQSNIITSSRLSGYRVVLTGGNMTTTLGQNATFNISLNWQNIGLAPPYENWTPTFELRNSSGTVVWSGTSSFKLKLFQPSGSATTVSDNFTLSGVSTGTYSLYMIIRDPNGYKKPFPLAITGRNSDGSYLLRSSVTVGTSSSQTLTANAGSDQSITLPTSSVSLSASGSAGSISSYAWTEVSGPNTASIGSPSSSSTTVSGLIQGTYVFKLSLNGGASTDQVTVTVNAAGSSSGSGGSIFTSQAPSSAVQTDGKAIEVGVKFRTNVSGTITGIRFYKVSGNSGTHTGELYNSSGTRLAQATFTGESSSGWQTVTFSSPVSVTANTTYVAACFSSAGYYSGTPNYFTSAVTNGSVTALADGTDGANGLYSYTTSPAFPSSSYSASNYWVDVVFSSSSSSSKSTSSSANIFTTQTPAGVTENDGRGIEVGVKFQSSVAGTITGIRFYKTSGNSGTHTGELYSSSGSRLAQAVFSGETSTGWQQVTFSTPISIAANTVFVAAYYSSSGNYVGTPGYFVSAVTNGSLTALADGTSGANGVYSYATSPTFPSSSYAQSNYWVDVIFSASGTSGAVSQQFQVMEVSPESDTMQLQSKLSYHLDQNYPNPSLGITRINYGVPTSGMVELFLYDMQGRIIKTMVNEVKEAGDYQYDLNTGNLPKGIYYYRMRSGYFVNTKKMMVL
jgi:hypothetical protein